jgi:hypothetical protein
MHAVAGAFASRAPSESTNESIANINVRGGTNDQNLMLWDNIKMYHSGHFWFNFCLQS